jgi:hypothetical protein
MPSKGKIVTERGGVKLTPYEIFREIQGGIKVAKTKWNKFSSFFYRSVEDIYNAWNELEVPLVLKISDEIIERAGRLFVEATAEVKDLKGNVVEFSKAQAELGSGKAGMSSEQATGSASSYARKYSLNGLFLLDDAKDPDAEEGKPDKSGKSGKSGTPVTTDEAAAQKAKIKELQEVIRGDKDKTAKATELLAGRSVIKLSIKDIDEIINAVKSK